MPNPVITSALLVGGYKGVAFSYQITATNSPTSFNANISPSGLPPGLSVNTTTGLISGTPTAASVWMVQLTATNGSGSGHATLELHIVKNGAPLITSSNSDTATINSPHTYQITGTNTPTSFNATGLPAGMSVDTGTGLISGTPTASGSFSVRVSATNAIGNDTLTVALNVLPGGSAPAITSSLNLDVFLGNATNYQITATNTPTSFGASSLPTGLSVNTGTGVISGTCTAAPGMYSATISATNGSGTGTATLDINVMAQGSITQPNFPNIPKGEFAFLKSGEKNLPSGVALSSVVGVSVSLPWAQMEPTQGAFNFSYFLKLITSIAGNGKVALLRPLTSGGSNTNGGNIPDDVFTQMGVSITDKHITFGVTYTYDDSGGNVVCTPVPWQSVYLARKIAFYQALGNWLTTSTDLTQAQRDSVRIIAISFANMRTEDWYLPNTTAVRTAGGPDGTGYPLSEVNRWLHLPTDMLPGAGYTTAQMITTGNAIYAACVTAFPGKILTLATNNNGPNLDSPNNGDYLAKTVFEAAAAAYGKPNVIIQRNNVETIIPVQSVSSGTTWALMGTEAAAGYALAGQALSAVWGDTVDTGGNGYRMNGGVDTDPDNVLPPPLTASEVYRKAAERLASYGAFFYECYEVDVTMQAPADTNYVGSLFGSTLPPPGQPPVINSVLSLIGSPNTELDYTITATNTPTAFQLALTSGDPTQVTFSVRSTTGQCRFTFLTTGSWQFSIGASNAFGLGTAVLNVAVNSPTPPPPPGGGPPTTAVRVDAFPELSASSEDDAAPCPNYLSMLNEIPPSVPRNLNVTTPMKPSSGQCTATWLIPLRT